MTGPGPVGCGDGALHEPQAVLAAAPDAYIAIDAVGRVVSWNPAARATFGHDHTYACGRDLADLIIPARYRAAHRAGLTRLGAGTPGRVLGQRLRLEALHADGHEFPVELTLAVTVGPAGQIFHAFCHDVTVERRVSRFIEVEATVSRGLAEAPSSHAAATRVVEALGVRMDWPVAELWLSDDEQQLVVCAARYAALGRRLGRFALDEMQAGVGLPGRVYQNGKPLWIPDLASDTMSLRSRAAARIGLHVAVGVPISTGGRTLGALCVYGDRVEDPEDSLTALLTGVAALVGQYLERRRAEELTVELARTKDEFLAPVTHELRNPLAVIMSTASLLEEELHDLLDVDQRRYVQTILRGAERLSVMAGDLLDLARLESGHLAIDPAPTDLRLVIEHAVAAAAAQAVDKNLAVTVDTPARLNLHADAGRLQQVADNLVSNALKYTPAGGTIAIRATADDENDGWIDWTVSDSGIGIPADERPHLFRRFYRASTALNRRIPGTGLGLVIVRTIVERHGGTITVADHPGPGTTFCIRLPIKPPFG